MTSPLVRVDVALGAAVTVTFDDGDGTVRTWHGMFGGVQPVETLRSADGRLTFVTGTPDRPDIPTRPFVRVRPGVSIPLRTQGLEPTSETHSISMLGLMFAVDAPGWTLEPITTEGQEFLRVNESASEKADRLLARFRTFDAAAASELEDVISRLRDEARWSGVDQGRDWDRI